MGPSPRGRGEKGKRKDTYVKRSECHMWYVPRSRPGEAVLELRVVVQLGQDRSSGGCRKRGMMPLLVRKHVQGCLGCVVRSLLDNLKRGKYIIGVVGLHV